MHCCLICLTCRANAIIYSTIAVVISNVRSTIMDLEVYKRMWGYNYVAVILRNGIFVSAYRVHTIGDQCLWDCTNCFLMRTPNGSPWYRLGLSDGLIIRIYNRDCGCVET